MNITRLKVDDLRHQLRERGLDTTGTRAVLIKRLRQAIDTNSPEPTLTLASSQMVTNGGTDEQDRDHTRDSEGDHDRDHDRNDSNCRDERVDQDEIVDEEDDQKQEEPGTATEADVDGEGEVEADETKSSEQDNEPSSNGAEDDDAIRRRHARFGTNGATSDPKEDTNGEDTPDNDDAENDADLTEEELIRRRRKRFGLPPLPDKPLESGEGNVKKVKNESVAAKSGKAKNRRDRERAGGAAKAVGKKRGGVANEKTDPGNAAGNASRAASTVAGSAHDPANLNAQNRRRRIVLKEPSKAALEQFLMQRQRRIENIERGRRGGRGGPSGGRNAPPSQRPLLMSAPSNSANIRQGTAANQAVPPGRKRSRATRDDEYERDREVDRREYRERDRSRERGVGRDRDYLSDDEDDIRRGHHEREFLDDDVLDDRVRPRGGVGDVDRYDYYDDDRYEVDDRYDYDRYDSHGRYDSRSYDRSEDLYDERDHHSAYDREPLDDEYELDDVEDDYDRYDQNPRRNDRSYNRRATANRIGGGRGGGGGRSSRYNQSRSVPQPRGAYNKRATEMIDEERRGPAGGSSAPPPAKRGGVGRDRLEDDRSGPPPSTSGGAGSGSALALPPPPASHPGPQHPNVQDDGSDRRLHKRQRRFGV